MTGIRGMNSTFDSNGNFKQDQDDTNKIYVSAPPRNYSRTDRRKITQEKFNSIINDATGRDQVDQLSRKPMSALLRVSASIQDELVKRLKAKGLNVRVNPHQHH